MDVEVGYIQALVNKSNQSVDHEINLNPKKKFEILNS